MGSRTFYLSILASLDILHTVGPTNRSKEFLKNCYGSCFKLALENNIKSLASSTSSLACPVIIRIYVRRLFVALPLVSMVTLTKELLMWHLASPGNGWNQMLIRRVIKLILIFRLFAYLLYFEHIMGTTLAF